MGVGAYTTAVLTMPTQMKSMALPGLYMVLKSVEIDPILGIIAGGAVAAIILLRATRDDEIASGANGAHITHLRWKAFILSALYAGIGGGSLGALHYLFFSQCVLFT